MKHRILLAISLVALTFVAYLPSFRAGFVYDDNVLLVHNERLQRWVAGDPSAGTTAKLLSADFAQIASRGGGIGQLAPIDYYRPVITATYLLDATFWGDAQLVPGGARWRSLEPFGFHLLNVLFHALNVVLVFVLTRSLVRGVRGATALAWFVSALFAVHPIHTESVSWIAGRTDVIATTFVLAAMWCWIRYRRAAERPARSGARDRRWAAAGAAYLFALGGIFTKEVAAIVVPLLAVYEWLDSRRGDGAGERSAAPRGVSAPALSRRLMQLAPMIAIVPIYFAVKASLVSAAGGDDDWRGVSWLTGFWTFWRASGWYALKMLWPVPLDLYPMIRFITAGPGAVWLLGHVVVGGLLVWWAFRTRSAAPALGLLGYCLALLPVSCLVPGLRLLRYGEDIDFPVAERFLYLPSFFLLLALGTLAVRCAPRRLLAVLAGLLVLGAGGATFLRGGEWRDDLSLYRAAVATSPRSVRMQTNYGLELVKSFRPEEAKVASFEGLRLQEEVYRRAPDPIAYENLSVAYFLEGDYVRGLRFMETTYQRVPALEYGMRYVFALVAVGAMSFDAAQFEAARVVVKDMAERHPQVRAVAEEQAVIEHVLAVWKAPRASDDATAALAETFFRLGLRLAMTGEARYVEALAVFDRGFAALPQGDLRDRPKTRARRDSMGQQYLEIVKAARARYAERLARDPTAIVHYLLGEVERRAGLRTADREALVRATGQFEQALARSPDHLGAALARAAFAVRSDQDADAAKEVARVAEARAARDRPLAAEEAFFALATAYRSYGTREPWGRTVRDSMARITAAVRSRAESAEAGTPAAKAWTDLGALHFAAAEVLSEPTRYGTAAEAFQKALSFDERFANAAASLVTTYERQGKKTEADALRKRMRERLPEHPFFR